MGDNVRLSDLPDGWRVACDTETSGLRPDSGARVSIVSAAWRDPGTGDLESVALPFDQGHLSLPLGEKDIPSRHQKRIARWSEEHSQEVAPNLPPGRYTELLHELTRFSIVYHNRKFDEVLLATGLRGRETDTTQLPVHEWLKQAFGWDTMVSANTLWPQYSPGLKPTAVRLELCDGGEDAEADTLKSFLGPKQGVNADPRFDLVPWSVIGPYAAQDAVLTLLLDEYQTEFITEGPNAWMMKLVEQDMAVTQTLMNMERRGVGWNTQRAKQMAKLLKGRQKELATIIPFKGGTGGPTSASAKQFFFGCDPDCPECGGKHLGCVNRKREPYPGKVTDTGAPQLDVEVQQILIKEGVEWAEEYHEHEKIKSAVSKWYDGWTEKVGADDRLRCDFGQTSVITGRLAGKHINLVAIPHDELLPDVPNLVTPRQLIEPKPGHRLFTVDVSQAEVRIGTAISECEGLLQGFLNGVDAHSQVAFMLFGTDEPPYRGYAKTLNLAMQYGAGVDRLRAQLIKDTGDNWTRVKTQQLRNSFREAAPEIPRAMRVAQHQAETLGYVRLWNGRFRWFEHYRSGQWDPPWTAFNAKCQGGMAEIMKIVMTKWDDAFPGTLLIQTHDDLVLELPNDGYGPERYTPDQMCRFAANRLVLEFEKAMTRPWRDRGGFVTVPFEAEIKEFA